MKLKKIDSKNYQCDKCGSYEKHIDMYNDEVCYNCWESKEKEIDTKTPAI